MFAQLQKAIDLEDGVSYKVSEIESVFTNALAPYNAVLARYMSMSPSELVALIAHDDLHCTDLSHTAFVDGILSVYRAAANQLLALSLDSAISKISRLEKKLLESVLHCLATYKYFVAIAHSYENMWSTISIIGSPSQPGVLLDIPECCGLLNATPDYTIYLRSLLSLIDSIVDYTTAAIIRICIAVGPRTSANQYMVALANLKLVTRLQVGFQSLDLKNDDLRRKIDGVKYSVQKINSLVYDLSLRKLIEGDVVVE